MVTKEQFYKDYRENEQLRESFFELANSIFGLNFQSWYEKGFWGKSYIPLSYVVEDKVVANVSINSIDLIIHGKQHRALQVGTVMTHPDYRNKGLSSRLLCKVLEEYKNTCDFIYLFANQSVLDFYPKFGFERVEEYQYSTKFSTKRKPKNKLRKLDILNMDDLNFIYVMSNERIPVSRRFATGNDQSILMYYCLNVFFDNMYYHESEDAIVIFNKGENQVEVFDIISKTPVNIYNILLGISGEGTTKIVFGFTPDYKGVLFERNKLKRDGALFVKTNDENIFPEYVKHPITSEA
ncbi:GNAT family N-acetyltransferase [Bacillus solitudinis]|uniref:GNAT family N-acetyltransferase n=1 Tax=Bacillus solitudinis TaxID=2014074 RepID=UPI000C23D0D2|nr:GNAT family N-acetyltransferase [Bacillus solitudinis]